MNDVGNVWTLPIGADGKFTLTARDYAGTKLTGYSGSETFPCTVWGGEDLLPIADVLSAAWQTVPPANALVTVDVSGAGTASLNSGSLQVRIMFSPDGSHNYPFYNGFLELSDTAGTATPGRVYCTLDDMELYAGDWLRTLQSETTAAGFLEERVRARDWLDQLIIAKSRRFANRVDISLGNPWGPVESWDWWIEDQLNHNLLITRPITREVTARKAIAFACEHQMSWEDNDVWEKRSRHYHKTANNQLLTYRVEIDLTGSNGPYASLAWNMGVFTFR